MRFFEPPRLAGLLLVPTAGRWRAEPVPCWSTRSGNDHTSW